MTDLTPEHREAVIEAVTQLSKGWVDAWENATMLEQSIAIACFLAGVRWAAFQSTEYLADCRYEARRAEEKKR